MLCFDDHSTEAKTILRGMNQGCPLSGIAYQFYNADLLETTKPNKKEDSAAFVDDTVIFMEGESITDVFKKLENVMEQEGGALEWAKTHECQFALNKFGQIGFTRKREPDPTLTCKT